MLCSCVERPIGSYDVEYEIEGVDQLSPNDYIQVIKQLESRFNKTEFSDSKIYFEDNVIKAEIPIYESYKETNSKVQALFTNFRVEFWDAYSLRDGIFSEIDSVAKDIKHFIPNSRKQIKHSSNALGFSNKKEHLENIILEMDSLFKNNENVDFFWSKKQALSQSKYHYILYSINRKKDRNLIVLDNTVIESAYSLENQSNPGKYRISLTFNERGKKAWAIMTKNAAELGNGAIAIIINNEVVSCPIVRSAITGGRSAIDADYIKKETENIAFQLAQTPLDYDLKLISLNTREYIPK